MTQAERPAEEQAASALNRSMAVGAGWMVLLRLADRAVGLATISVLARILRPEDFGLIAMAVSVIAVVEMFGAFGLEIALIRNNRTDCSAYDTAWTFNLIVGVVLSSVLFALALPAASFFQEPRLIAIMRWLALATLIGSAANIGVIEFRKNLQFQREFRWGLSARVIGSATALAFALFWQEYWALVAGVLAQAIARAALSYALHEYRPRLSLRGLPEMFSFSKWMLAQNVINGLNERAAPLLIGRVAGAAELAHFSISFEISNLATTDLAAPMRRAIFPGFAKVAADISALRKTFISSFSMVVLIGVPVPLGIAVTAPLSVPVFLGEQWLATIPLVQILSLYGMVRALDGSSHLVNLALGKPRGAAQLSAMRLALLLPLLTWGTLQSGVMGAAWALLASALMLWGLDILFVTRALRLGFRTLLASIWRTLLSASVMVGVVYVFQYALPAPRNILECAAQLAASAGIGAIVYSTAVLCIWRLCGSPAGAEGAVYTALRPRFRLRVR